jgi:uncharacterized membrane protein
MSFQQFLQKTIICACAERSLVVQNLIDACLCTLKQFEKRRIVTVLQRGEVCLKTLRTILLLFSLEYVTHVKLLEVLVCKVYTELLKRVNFEVFKAKNV